jgi:hypothetical protein
MDYILIRKQIEYTHHVGVLKYADNESWGDNVKGQYCMMYEDDGNGVSITLYDPQTDTGKMMRLDYSELQQLAIMISLHAPCDYKLLRSV